MGVVMDRGRRVATFLRAHTGSPKWKFRYGTNGTGRGFDAPNGLVLDFMSCKHAGDAVLAARSMKDDERIAGVVYLSYYTEPDDAVVMLPIRSYTRLLAERLEQEGGSR